MTGILDNSSAEITYTQNAENLQLLSLEKEDVKNFEITLAAIYTSLVSLAAIFHKFGMPEMRIQDSLGKLSPFEQLLLHNVFDYIGNNRNGFLLSLSTIAVDLSVTIADQHTTKKEIKNILMTIREWYPYFVITLFFLSNIDTEWLKILPWSFGSPTLLDIPAGVFGMLAGVTLYEVYRKGIRQKWEKRYLEEVEKEKALATQKTMAV